MLLVSSSAAGARADRLEASHIQIGVTAAKSARCTSFRRVRALSAHGRPDLRPDQVRTSGSDLAAAPWPAALKHPLLSQTSTSHHLFDRGWADPPATSALKPLALQRCRLVSMHCECLQSGLVSRGAWGHQDSIEPEGSSKGAPLVEPTLGGLGKGASSKGAPLVEPTFDGPLDDRRRRCMGSSCRPECP